MTRVKFEQVHNILPSINVANSVDPDQGQCSAAADLGLHCLLRTGCPNT